MLATVLFTDIVGSTARAEQMGDRRWRDLLDARHASVRRELARYRGSEVKSLVDGFLATFDGPARAVRCARAITEAIRPLEIEVRCGLHTGEIEITVNDVQGIAVHIASRVSSLAGAGEAALADAMTARDRECKGAVGKFCREREAVVNERRQALDAAMQSVGQAADPQTDAAIRILAW